MLKLLKVAEEADHVQVDDIAEAVEVAKAVEVNKEVDAVEDF